MLCLLIDNGNGNFTDPTLELELERVAHAPNLGQLNPLSMKWLAHIPPLPLSAPTVGVDRSYSARFD